MNIRYFYLLTMVFFIAPNFVFAQDDEAADVEEVIVTATKRETNLMETPLAVSVITQEQMALQGLSRISDLSSLVPNLVVGNSGEDSGVSIAIRGVSSNNYTELGDPTVAVHVDGMYTPRAQAALALAHDIERIEVLRGPQGTLFGRNSTSGAVNVISARPKFGDEMTGRMGVRLSVDGRNMNEFDGFLNIPVSDEIAFRASFKSSLADSFINQTVDRYDWSLDYNRNGTIGVNVSAAPTGTPQSGQVDWADGRDIVADGIPNVDQRRAREVDASDAYYNVDNSAIRLGMLYAPVDKDFEWYVSFDKFEDNGAGSIYLKDCEQAELTRGQSYDFSCDTGASDPFHAAINNPGELDLSIETIRSELKFKVSDNVVGEFRVALGQHDRFQMYDGDGGFHTSPTHPAYGFVRNHPDSMMMNWNALRGHFGGIYGQQYGWGPRVEGSNGTGFNGDAYFQNTAWDMGYDNCEMGWGGSVESSFAYGCQYSFWMQDLDAVASLLGLSPGNAAAALNNAVKPMWFDELYRTIQNNESNVIELQFKSDGDGDVQWVAGVFMMDEDTYTRFDVEMPFLGPIIRPLHEIYLQPERTTETQAIFGQLDYETGVDGLNLTLGYRHTWDEKEDQGGRTYKTYGYFDNANAYCNGGPCFWFESYDFVGDTTLVSDAGGIFTYAPWNQYYQSDDLLPSMGISGSDDLSAFVANASNDYKASWDQGTWRIGADYVANEDLFVYASVATGYKAGGFGDNVDRGDGQFINFEYDPEFNTTYELGFKSVHLDGDLKLLGNVFYSDYEDMQRTLFGFVGYRELDGQAVYTLMTKNVPNSTIQGVELEFDWKPYEAGRLFGWVSMLDTENGGSSSAEATQDGYLCMERALVGVDPCSADGTIDLSGKHLTWSPELSWNLQFEHNTYTGNGFRIMNIVSANYTGEMFYNESNYDHEPFHSGRDDLYTVNTSMVFINEANAWGLEFYVHNATDELIKTDSYPANAGFVKAMYAPPMAYGVRFQKDF